MKVITRENLLRLILSLVTILGLIVTPVLPANGTSALDRVWVQMPTRTGSSLGMLNVSSGEIMPVSGLALPEGARLISESFDGRYVAFATSIRTKTSVSPVIVVAKIHQEARQINLEPYTTLPGYSKASWSPNTLELLLSRSNWSRVSVWRVPASAALETAPIEIGIDDVCDAAWGNTSNTILISVCAGDRRLVSYERGRRQQTVLISYSKRVLNDFLHFATLSDMSQDDKRIMLFAYTDPVDVFKGAIEGPVVLTGRWLILNAAQRKYQVVSRLFASGAPKFGVFLSSDRLLMIGQTPLTNTASGWDYVQYSMEQDKVTPLMLADRSCPRTIVPLKQDATHLLIEYTTCGDGLTTGIYRFDVDTAQRERITLKGSDLWQLISISLQ